MRYNSAFSLMLTALAAGAVAGPLPEAVSPLVMFTPSSLTAGPYRTEFVGITNSGTEPFSLLGANVLTARSPTLNYQILSEPKGDVNPGETVYYTLLFAPASFTGENTYEQVEDLQTALLCNRLEISTSASAVPTVSIDLRGEAFNYAPIGVADSYEIFEDEPLFVDATDGGLLVNDTDQDTPRVGLWAVLDTPPAFAESFELERDGSFSYVPQLDYNGEDSFSYWVTDGFGKSGPIPVDLTILSVIDPPVMEVVVLPIEGPTNSRLVSLIVEPAPMPDPPDLIEIAEVADFSAAAQVAFKGQTSVEYELQSPADGEIPVFVRYRNEGGVSAVQEVAVLLDETPPATAPDAPLALQEVSASTPEFFSAQVTLGFTEPVFTRTAGGPVAGLLPEAITLGGEAGPFGSANVAVAPIGVAGKSAASRLSTATTHYQVTVSGGASSTGSVTIGLEPGMVQDEAGNALLLAPEPVSFTIGAGVADWMLAE